MSELVTDTYDPNWQDTYRHLVATPEAAVARIRPGQRVFIGSGCAQPRTLVHALVARAPELVDTELVHLLTLGDAPYAQPDMARIFRINSFFIADNVRRIIQEGLGAYTPIFLSEIPELFNSGQLPLDAALIQVCPPDARGYCSFGVSVDIVKSAAENASLVIAQVNPRMPRTLGDSFVHVYDLDVLVPVDEELHEIEPLVKYADTDRIGEYVAALIDDGSTVEVGIGEVAQSVLQSLKDKKDLGIHTEMFTDALIDLIESGVVTGARKTLDRGKVVASFCLGSRRLYDYVDNNPVFSFHPTEYVNDPFVISRQDRMVAVNVALEIDLTGQVCADSLGSRFFSGIGGQVDFNRGAARSRGGKAIVALPSTAVGGTVSRIVGRLTPGAGVVTTRGDVHYVVTEYGAAYLHGKSIEERALALISIAHPDFRAQLLREALDAKYVRQELADVEGRIVLGPRELRTTYLMPDGTQVHFRPVHPTDEPLLRDLFYQISRQSIYYRFMSHMRWVPSKQIQDFVYIDHRTEVAIVGTLPVAGGEEIIALGGYYLDPTTNRAEVAFVVQDAWQDRGIGSFMLRNLATIAKRNGISGLTADVLPENKAMQAVFFNSDLKVKSKLEDGAYSFTLDFN
jgi:acyl-CoA hydrolase/RimJ/RimL family protein N-acetyltransferase